MHSTLLHGRLPDRLPSQQIYRPASPLIASRQSRRSATTTRCSTMGASGGIGDWTRRDTPGILHFHAAHFNAAGSALPTQQVLDAQKNYLDDEATLGGYEAAVEHAEALQLPYDALAELLHCNPEEIAIVQSATTAWQQVFFGLQFAAGDRILTSVQEYGSNYINFLQAQKRHGVVIEVVPQTPDGDADTTALEELILTGTKPKLVAISHIGTGSGRVYDAAAVGRVTRRHNVPYLLDACQSVGQLPLDVREIGCDWLSGTSRKYLRGPRGIGFLYASREVMKSTEPAMLDMWGGEWTARDAYVAAPTARRYEQYEVAFSAKIVLNGAWVKMLCEVAPTARRYEQGDVACATKVGLGVAVRQALDVGPGAAWERIRELANSLRGGLAGIPGVTVRDSGRLLCGLVSWTKEGHEPADIRTELREECGIHVWISPLSSTRIDMEDKGLDMVVRSSVHYYNTAEEVEDLVAAVRKL